MILNSVILRENEETSFMARFYHFPFLNMFVETVLFFDVEDLQHGLYV